MIDRIKFYIDDVDIETVEKRLDLVPIGVDRLEAETYLSTIKNLKFKYVGRRLMVEGSLHRFAKGNNYSYLQSKNQSKPCGPWWILSASLLRNILYRVSRSELICKWPVSRCAIYRWCIVIPADHLSR